MALTKKAQEVVDYMRAEREQFLATADGLSDAQLSFKPAADQWSIREIFHHIWMVEGLTAKLMANLLKQAVENNLPQDTDNEISVLNSLDAHAETLRARFQAPERVVPLETLPLAESIARMAETRARILEPLDELCRYDVSGMLYPHPALGPINPYQWLLVMGGHEARHRRQIKRIKEDANYPTA
jgi:uncharacterized damage-inducible protein DinB